MREVPISPYPFQHFRNNIQFNGCEVISHGFACTSLTISDVEHLIMYLMAIYLSSLEKCLFKIFFFFFFATLIICGCFQARDQTHTTEVTCNDSARSLTQGATRELLFLIGVFSVLLLSCRSSLYVFTINPLSDYSQQPRQRNNQKVHWWLNRARKCIYILEYYLVLGKKEVLSYTTTWMDLGALCLSKISQSHI